MTMDRQPPHALRQGRRNRGLTQQQLADRLAEHFADGRTYTRQVVQQWEAGRQPPPLEVVVALAAIVDVDETTLRIACGYPPAQSYEDRVSELERKVAALWDGTHHPGQPEGGDDLADRLRAGGSTVERVERVGDGNEGEVEGSA